MDSEQQVYDKAKWHYEGDRYPEGLPESNAYTHGGFLLAWLLDNGLLSSTFLSDFESQILQFRNGEISAGQLYESTDGVLDSDMLTETGNSFGEDYIDESFLEDYEMMFEDDYDSIYEVPYTKKNMKKVSKMLNEAFSEWKDEMGDD